MRVEPEIGADVHFGTGPQIGIKDKMRKAAAEESMAKTFNSGNQPKRAVLNPEK